MKNYLRLLSYLRPYKAVVAATWVLSLLVLALQGISVWVGAGFIEKLLIGQPPGLSAPQTGELAHFMDRIAVGILQRDTPFQSLITGVGVLLGATFFTTGFRVLKTYLFSRINQIILTNIRSQMFACLTRFELSFSREHRPGEVAMRFIRDVDLLETAIIDAVDRVFMQPLRLIMAFALMASLSLELTLWTFGCLLLSSTAVHLSGDRIEILTDSLLDKAAKLQGRLAEYLSAVILARSLGREEHEKERFDTACQDLARQAVRLNVVRSLAPQLINNLFLLSGGILLLFGGYKVMITQALPGSVLVKMILLVPVATYPIMALATLYLSVRESMAGAKRIYTVLDAGPAHEDKPDAVAPGPLSSCITLKNIGYSVNGQVVLKDISLKIFKGSKVVIYGPSGAGKTTLLSLLSGFIQPSQGQILVDGVDMRNLKGAAWRRRLGIVLQEPILLNGTVRDNLLYARPDASDDLLRRVLKESFLWNTDCVFARGLDTPVGNRGDMVSGGERQRLTIARALLNDPDIFLMDEPTAMLDVTNKEKIRDAICSVAKSRTLVLVTHDPLLQQIADVQYRLDSGRLVRDSQ